ncbi:uncharacterized protein LOC129629506 isoform X4 [Bubalus kerabau]|uniref:uncharacterized protein LOC129629506 isoform X4 n=1 Tax=Bubalus carabanensis TaxID=3119969 RepID=UPI00244EFAFE|nr:uncharacterized protein LOC129629506 isoform X4 [Bubalus carabanensis]
MTCSCLEPEWQIHPAYWAQGWVTPQRLLLRDAWTTCGPPPHLRAEGSSVNDPAGQGGACSTSCPSASAVLAESCHFPSRSLLGLHVCFSLDPLRPPPLLALSVTAATSLPGFWITRLEFESASCCRGAFQPVCPLPRWRTLRCFRLVCFHCLRLGRYRQETFLALEQAGCLANKKGSCPLQLWTTWESRYRGDSGRAEVQVCAFRMLPPQAAWQLTL